MLENRVPLEKLKFIINNMENHITKSDEPSRGQLELSLYVILITFLCFFTYHFCLVCLLDIPKSQSDSFTSTVVTFFSVLEKFHYFVINAEERGVNNHILMSRSRTSQSTPLVSVGSLGRDVLVTFLLQQQLSDCHPYIKLSV